LRILITRLLHNKTPRRCLRCKGSKYCRISCKELQLRKGHQSSAGPTQNGAQLAGKTRIQGSQKASLAKDVRMQDIAQHRDSIAIISTMLINAPYCWRRSKQSTNSSRHAEWMKVEHPSWDNPLSVHCVHEHSELFPPHTHHFDPFLKRSVCFQGKQRDGWLKGVACA
jgi:hypothetical protein